MQDSLSDFSFHLIRKCIHPILLNIKFNYNKFSCTILQLRASVLSYHPTVIALSQTIVLSKLKNPHIYARMSRRNKNVTVSSLLEHTFCGSDKIISI